MNTLLMLLFTLITAGAGSWFHRVVEDERLYSMPDRHAAQRRWGFEEA